MNYELKPLTSKNLSAAIELAKHYRDLNEPEEAESICRDVVAVAPDNEDAWRTLGLALTDQFPSKWMTLFDEARSSFNRLTSDFERVYYAGITWERYAKAQLEAGRAHNAIHAFEEALKSFEEAEKIGPKDLPNPIVHYNLCVRALTTHPELVRASTVPHEPEYEFGD